MKLRIISDGTREGTHVIDAETGKEVEGVLKVRISIDRDGVEAEITVAGVDLDIIGFDSKEQEA